MRSLLTLWTAVALVVLIWDSGSPGTFSKPMLYFCGAIYAIHSIVIMFEVWPLREACKSEDQRDRHRTDSEQVLVRDGGQEQDSVRVSEDFMVEDQREARGQF